LAGVLKVVSGCVQILTNSQFDLPGKDLPKTWEAPVASPQFAELSVG
jgi:hypothetical protein